MKKQRYARGWLYKHLVKAHRAALRFERAPTPEAVHDFRVALRRTRTLMKAYASFLDEGFPPKAMLSLRRMGRSLGRARDPHVFQKKLARLRRRTGTVPANASFFSRRLAEDEQRNAAAARRMLPRYYFAEKDLIEALNHRGPASSAPSSYVRWERKWLLRLRKKLTQAHQKVANFAHLLIHNALIHSVKPRYVA